MNTQFGFMSPDVFCLYSTAPVPTTRLRTKETLLYKSRVSVVKFVIWYLYLVTFSFRRSCSHFYFESDTFPFTLFYLWQERNLEDIMLSLCNPQLPVVAKSWPTFKEIMNKTSIASKMLLQHTVWHFLKTVSSEFDTITPASQRLSCTMFV